MARQALSSCGPYDTPAVSMHAALALAQVFVWKEIDYGGMTEKEKQLLVQEVGI